MRKASHTLERLGMEAYSFHAPSGGHPGASEGMTRDKNIADSSPKGEESWSLLPENLVEFVTEPPWGTTIL